MKKIKIKVAKPNTLIKEDEPDKYPRFFLNTGSRVLNLALSGDAWDGGWAGQRVINIVGDTTTGKTLLACEAVNQLYYNWYKKGKNVKVSYSDPESAFDYRLGKDFGMPIEWINWWIPKHVEDFFIQTYVDLRESENIEFHLSILDSLDALPDSESLDRAEKLMDGKEVSGTYGARKAKESKAGFMQLANRAKEKNMSIIIISQVIDNISSFGQSRRLKRAGGHGLDHFASQIVWLKEIGKIPRTVTLGGKPRKISVGKKVEVWVSKNRLYREGAKVTIDILDRHGVDDYGTILNWLDEWGFMEKKKQTYTLLGEKGTKDKLIKKLEDSPAFYKKTVNYLQKCWDEIEDKLKPNRKKKYS